MQLDPVVSQENSIKPLVRRVLGLALPMAWSRFIQMFGWFIGMLMVAHLSKSVLAASALINATQVAVCVIFMSLLFAMGVVSGRLFGAGRQHEIGALLQQGLMLGVILGFCMMIAFFFVGHLLLFTGQPVQLVQIIQSYFHVFAWTSIPLMLLVVLQQFCYGILKQRLVIINNLISLSLFIPATYIFTFGGLGIAPMGIVGLAYAILLQTTVNLLTLFYSLYMLAGFKHFDLFARHDHRGLKHIKQLFQVGWPMSVQFGGELLAFFALTLFTGWIGTSALAASQIVQQVVLLFLVPLFAVSEAAGILVSQHIGAQQISNVERIGNVSLMIGLIAVGVLSILFLVIPDQLTSMYIDIHDPASFTTVKLARWLFFLSGLMLLFDTIRNLYSGSLRGFYDTQYPMWISLIVLWVIVVPLAYLLGLSFDFGVIGIRVGTIIGFIFGSVILWRRWEFKIRTLATK